MHPGRKEKTCHQDTKAQRRAKRIGIYQFTVIVKEILPQRRRDAEDRVIYFSASASLRLCGEWYFRIF